jgi:hypothetical protein
MEARPSLDEQRATWKGLVAEDLEAALESIWSVVKGHSSRTDGILAMLGQYRQLEADNQKGILRYEEWLLQVNRLRHQLLDWLDDLSGEDLGWETAELQTPLQVASDNESPLAQLQILDEEHGRVLAFFPKVNRLVRQQLIRADRQDPLNARLAQTLHEALPVFQACFRELSLLHEHRRRIQLYTEEPGLWRQSKRFLNMATDLEVENWQDIIGQQAAIRNLRNQLQSKGLIPTS